MTDIKIEKIGRKSGKKLVGYCEAYLVVFHFVLALLGGTECCNKKSKKNYEDFQGLGKKSMALRCFTLYWHFIRSESLFVLSDCESS